MRSWSFALAALLLAGCDDAVLFVGDDGRCSPPPAEVSVTCLELSCQGETRSCDDFQLTGRVPFDNLTAQLIWVTGLPWTTQTTTVSANGCTTDLTASSYDGAVARGTVRATTDGGYQAEFDVNGGQCRLVLEAR